MSNHTSLPGVGTEWQSNFTQYPAYKDFAGNSDVDFNHIYLDLERELEANLLHGTLLTASYRCRILTRVLPF